MYYRPSFEKFNIYVYKKKIKLCLYTIKNRYLSIKKNSNTALVTVLLFNIRAEYVNTLTHRIKDYSNLH